MSASSTFSDRTAQRRCKELQVPYSSRNLIRSPTWLNCLEIAVQFLDKNYTSSTHVGQFQTRHHTSLCCWSALEASTQPSRSFLHSARCHRDFSERLDVPIIGTYGKSMIVSNVTCLSLTLKVVSCTAFSGPAWQICRVIPAKTQKSLKPLIGPKFL
jgi:hypothetical protein